MNREEHVARLQSEAFDLLVIGGGATGTGIALDAATRNLKVALVERDDFAAGTSSRSTKLIHGGVRYLEQAVLRRDRSQFDLVRDALKERAVLLKIAPHLSQPLPIVMPLYNPLQIPYFFTGLKLYDALAGKANLAPSQFLSAKEIRDRLPMLRSAGLWGGVLYYDGQFNDARMNVALALTAAEAGVVVANHVEVVALNKANGKLCGATVRDRLSGDSWEIVAKVVINATGPFSDTIRQLDEPSATPMLRLSSGSHLVLAQQFSLPTTGILIPKTEDGRVLFILPWLGHTLVGTTDNSTTLSADPQASQEDIEYILRHLQKYFSIPVTQQDVRAAWAGLRPLVSDPKAADTAKLSRDHVINVSNSGLLTITGGKWTTYRKMALDTVNAALTLGNLNCDRPSQTESLKLAGAENYSAQGDIQLQTTYGLTPDVATHLNQAYGDRAIQVAELAREGYGQRLAKNYPYLEAEVVYGAKQEAARSSSDILARRTRLSFLDHQATQSTLPRVVELLGNTLGWSQAQQQADLQRSATALEVSATATSNLSTAVLNDF
ncbi:glycerol-3-phosphate dehydrogenase/oxidase [Trichocoleus sp. FACHB-262]|uniref:glycerol-3-phosphate dehydrogenase/oxidase n=1 Tax=Trichocoleus sp. FACHB-262 TaxID=2692869 RepID=UPI0016891929|nr:FAD-dependent oxidoreductase [Trichocoleus sp. FACHB-262]MBD2120801.1 FAD-dependent oxidoreductase [Trichocoleus sp. FACHB-262]